MIVSSHAVFTVVSPQVLTTVFKEGSHISINDMVQAQICS